MENIRIQYIAIVGSILLLLFILFLIRQKKLKEEYSFLWLFFSVVFITLSFWRSALDHISDLVGITYPPAALFLILLMAVFIIMIEFSVIISKQSVWIKNTAQDIGIMKLEIEKLKQRFEHKIEN